MTVMELSPGFADPVRESALAFRAMLDAMSNPGRVVELPILASPPDRFSSAATVVALSLLDADTPVWIDPELRSEAVESYLRFHAGCPIVERADQCRFAFLTASGVPLATETLPIGTPEYPDRSATAVVLCNSLAGGEVRTLRGPGIANRTDFAPIGLSTDGWQALSRNAALFPLGIDTIFVSGNAVAALPRSTRISGGEG